MSKPTAWTPERVATLKTLWGERKSAREIAELLGADLTRNAVIGKAHRLGLSEPSNARKPTRAAPAAPEPASMLVPGRCCWPIGDTAGAEFRFCGARADAGISYCAEHARLAYRGYGEAKRA